MFSIAHAQEVVEAVQVAQPVVQEVSVVEFLTFLFQSFNGLKGAGALGAAGILVQVILKFLGSPLAKSFFKNQSSGLKLVIVSALSVIAGVLALVIAGVTLPAALIHGSTLAAYSVLAHQVYKHFFEKKIESDQK